MDILVECSGYELLNLGDLAMLQAGVERLRKLWPDATLSVVTDSPERLADYCPGTLPVPLGWPSASQPRWLPRRGHMAASWSHKVVAPRLTPIRQVSTPLVRAIRKADLVVATGGGFVNDSFRLHAAGVLSAIEAAQRRGCLTAMFGQGIGPMTQPFLLRKMMAVLPRLSVLGLREAGSALLLERLGVDCVSAKVTGDDALALAGAGLPAASGHALGVNVRATSYTGLSCGFFESIREVLGNFSLETGAPVLGLPISRYNDEDLWATRQAMPLTPGVKADIEDLTTPAALATAVSSCRAVVTASYHAAVFALARGIPVVGLSRSRYYDLKFDGLRRLFPAGACYIAAVGGPEWTGQLSKALSDAWGVSYERREAFSRAAADMVDSCQLLYDRLGQVVDQRASKIS